MRPRMIVDQLMFLLFNNLRNDFELQLLILKKQIRSKDNTLSTKEPKEESSIKLEKIHCQLQKMDWVMNRRYLLGNLKKNAKTVVAGAMRQPNVSESKCNKKKKRLTTMIVKIGTLPD
jgi:hypothetical protein